MLVLISLNLLPSQFYLKELQSFLRRAFLYVFACMSLRKASQGVHNSSTRCNFSMICRPTGTLHRYRYTRIQCLWNYICSFKILQSYGIQYKLTVLIANDEVNCHFNSLAAPYIGGLWEAAVKFAKHHLRRIMGYRGLFFEKLEGQLC